MDDYHIHVRNDGTDVMTAAWIAVHVPYDDADAMTAARSALVWVRGAEDLLQGRGR